MGTSKEGDINPYVELQELGISRLATPARGSRIAHLAAITTTHHPRGCEDAALGSCQNRDGKPTTRRRGLGATANEAAKPALDGHPPEHI